MQFLAARSLWTTFSLARYSIPLATCRHMSISLFLMNSTYQDVENYHYIISDIDSICNRQHRKSAYFVKQQHAPLPAAGAIIILLAYYRTRACWSMCTYVLHISSTARLACSQTPPSKFRQQLSKHTVNWYC